MKPTFKKNNFPYPEKRSRPLPPSPFGLHLLLVRPSPPEKEQAATATAAAGLEPLLLQLRDQFQSHLQPGGPKPGGGGGFALRPLQGQQRG